MQLRSITVGTLLSLVSCFRSRKSEHHSDTLTEDARIQSHIVETTAQEVKESRVNAIHEFNNIYANEFYHSDAIRCRLREQSGEQKIQTPSINTEVITF